MTSYTLPELLEIYHQPFNQLLFQAQSVHQKHFKDEVELCTLLSIKTGSCPEDCKYCPQSGHYKTNVEKEKLLPCNLIVARAKKAKEMGAKRFCMGAAWRNPPKSKMPELINIIQSIKDLGLETCMTLGMLTKEDSDKLAEAGLDYYNHNIDTSESYYPEIITTRTFSSRIETLKNVSSSGMKVCSGGILGMGETTEDRLEMLLMLASLDTPPASVPINKLIPVPGTPLGDELKMAKVDNFDFVRTIAVARILLPTSKVRLSAGRTEMSEEMQALCFMAGANSIFYGEKLLTTANPDQNNDLKLLKKLGLGIESNVEAKAKCIDQIDDESLNVL